MNQKKLNYLLVLLFFFLIFSLFLINIPANRIQADIANLNQIEQPENQNFAETQLEIDLSAESTTYKRETIATVSGIYLPGDLFRTYRIIADLTTHNELYLQFTIEWNADSPLWNNNFNFFRSSPIVNDYNNSYEALKQLVQNEEIVEVLKISSRSFRLHSSTIPEFDTITKSVSNQSIFVIEEKIIVKETTAFVLNLFEPFKFDLNDVQLGSLSNFKFESEFNINDGTNAFIHESLQLSASGSLLKRNTTTKGYNGELRFDYDTRNLESYRRAFTELPYDVNWKITIPSDQQIKSIEFDTEFLGQADNNVDEIGGINPDQKNLLEFNFKTDDLVPASVIFSTNPPVVEIWAQISLSDYLSFAGSVFIGLIAVVKVIPFYFSRRSTGGYKKKLHKTVLKNNWKEFEQIKQDSLDRYLKGKISLGQIESILNEVKIIKENFDTIQKVTNNNSEQDPH